MAPRTHAQTHACARVHTRMHASTHMRTRACSTGRSACTLRADASLQSAPTRSGMPVCRPRVRRASSPPRPETVSHQPHARALRAQGHSLQSTRACTHASMQNASTHKHAQACTSTQKHAHTVFIVKTRTGSRSVPSPCRVSRMRSHTCGGYLRNTDYFSL